MHATKPQHVDYDFFRLQSDTTSHFKRHGASAPINFNHRMRQESHSRFLHEHTGGISSVIPKNDPSSELAFEAPDGNNTVRQERALSECTGHTVRSTSSMQLEFDSLNVTTFPERTTTNPQKTYDSSQPKKYDKNRNMYTPDQTNTNPSIASTNPNRNEFTNSYLCKKNKKTSSLIPEPAPLTTDASTRDQAVEHWIKLLL